MPVQPSCFKVGAIYPAPLTPGVGAIDTPVSHPRFCLFSLILVILAVAVQGGALRDWSRNGQIRAQAVSAAPEKIGALRAEADWFSHRGSVLYMIGLCLAVAALASLVASFRRHEPAHWHSVPVAPLALYLCSSLSWYDGIQAMHRMSGTDIVSRFEWLWLPLNGDLDRYHPGRGLPLLRSSPAGSYAARLYGSGAGPGSGLTSSTA
jgi:hypothetical protein